MRKLRIIGWGVTTFCIISIIVISIGSVKMSKKEARRLKGLTFSDYASMASQEPAPDPVPVTDGIKWTGLFLMPPELDGVELGLKDDGTVVWRIPKEGKFWKKEK